MALENLFATEPSLPNVAKVKMPENTDKWAETLTTMVREQFPDIVKLPISVTFKKRDDQSGTAIGAVHVVSPDVMKSVYIPFIVEKFHMYPLDVWMETKTQAVHPLTKDTFKEVFFSQNFADGMDARPTDSSGTYFNDPSMWTSNYPPLQGRYSYASAGYQILDEISDTMTEEDVRNFKAELTSSPTLLQKFAQKGHGDLIKKLAAKTSFVNTNNMKASADKLIPTSVLDVKREGYDKYSILSMADGLYDLATSHTMDRDACKQFLSNIIGKAEDFLNDVDQNGEKMLVVRPAPTEGVWLFDVDAKKPEIADKFQCYWVKNKQGLMIDALVIPRVVDFTGKAIKGKIVLSRRHSCMQDEVAGIPYKDSGCAQEVLRPANVRTGQSGTFVYVGVNGEAIATEPVTIRAIEEHGGPLDVVTLSGKKLRVKLGWGNKFETVTFEKRPEAVMSDMKEKETATLESLGFVETKKDHFVIPSKMMWIPMEPMTEVCDSTEDWMNKEAAANMDANPVELRYTGLVFDIRGGGLPKLAMSERETKLLLSNLGASQEKIAHIIKKAKYGKAVVHKCAPLRSKKEVEKNASATLQKVATVAASLKQNLVKMAAEIEDKATVDTLLSLGFINADNLAKFLSYKPVFEKVSDYLAEITMASRLGLKEVDQAAAVGAMKKLLEVIEGLKKLESGMKRPATKAQ